MTNTKKQEHIKKRQQLRKQIKTTDDEMAKNNLRRQIIDDEISQNREETNELNREKEIIESAEPKQTRTEKIQTIKALVNLGLDKLEMNDKDTFVNCLKRVIKIIKSL